MSLISNMPKELKKAQEAINLPEVQKMMEKLAKYNLGICMPHMHTEDRDFEVLPNDVVQIETNLNVSFKKRSELKNRKAVPVAWKWMSNGIKEQSMCVASCYPQNNGHRTFHNQI